MAWYRGTSSCRECPQNTSRAAAVAMLMLVVSRAIVSGAIVSGAIVSGAIVSRAVAMLMTFVSHLGSNPILALPLPLALRFPSPTLISRTLLLTLSITPTLTPALTYCRSPACACS